MPELPDLTVYVRAIEERTLGKTLTAVRVGNPFVLRTVAPGPEAFAGRRLERVRRVGKRIVLCFDGGLIAAIHLMVAGRLHWRKAGAPLGNKASIAALDFENGTLLLTEAATRKRAALHLLSGEAALRALDAGGIEPLDSSPEQYAAVLRRENHTLKRALTDPRLFAGIGNAYSDEILLRARLSPIKLSQKLTDEEIVRLHDATHTVLTEWIRRLTEQAREDFPDKVTAFRPEMAAHGKFGSPCPACGTPIQRLVYAENECDYCPTCQTEGRLLADRALSRLLKADWPKTLRELEEMKASRRE